MEGRIPSRKPFKGKISARTLSNALCQGASRIETMMRYQRSNTVALGGNREDGEGTPPPMTSGKGKKVGSSNIHKIREFELEQVRPCTIMLFEDYFESVFFYQTLQRSR